MAHLTPDLTLPSLQTDLRLPTFTDPPTTNIPAQQKTWVIFGATGHIGRSLVRNALSHGDKVVAVGRVTENSLEQMQNWHENCYGLLCDVRMRPTVQDVFDKALARWQRIDIIVNCTGYGVVAACEDQDDNDLRTQFEINFLGTLNIIQLSLPIYRKQSADRAEDNDEFAGRYIIFSSTSGALGIPGLGPYCATKYAVEGLVESMLYEVDAFAIKATLVQPGHMRLDDPGVTRTPADQTTAGNADTTEVRLPKYGHFLVKTPSQPYDTPSAPAGHARRIMQWLIDRQPVSALKSAELVWQLGHCKYPPLRLVLGSHAVDLLRDRLKSITEEIEDWKHLCFGVQDDGNAPDGDKDGDKDAGSKQASAELG